MTDPLVRWMQAKGIPLTRANYLAHAYPEGLPEEWGAELEGGLPVEIQVPLKCFRGEQLSEVDFAELAWRRAEATADADERWSFLFRTEGAIGLTVAPWGVLENLQFDAEFDPACLSEFGLEWEVGRVIELAKGSADPTPDELRAWRIGKARAMLRDSDESCVPVWVTPIHLFDVPRAFAVFAIGESGAVSMIGVFADLAAALAEIDAFGVRPLEDGFELPTWARLARGEGQ